MSNNFIITKAFPASAILLIYWLGTFNLPTIIFLPIALSIAVLIFYVTRKYGEKKQEKEKEEKLSKENTETKK